MNIDAQRVTSRLIRPNQAKVRSIIQLPPESLTVFHALAGLMIEAKCCRAAPPEEHCRSCWLPIAQNNDQGHILTIRQQVAFGAGSSSGLLVWGRRLGPFLPVERRCPCRPAPSQVGQRDAAAFVANAPRHPLRASHAVAARATAHFLR